MREIILRKRKGEALLVCGTVGIYNLDYEGPIFLLCQNMRNRTRDQSMSFASLFSRSAMRCSRNWICRCRSSRAVRIFCSPSCSCSTSRKAGRE